MHPFNKKRSDKKKVPWITSEIKKLINKRVDLREKPLLKTLKQIG
jgi:hypothetical protein